MRQKHLDREKEREREIHIFDIFEQVRISLVIASFCNAVS